MKHFTTGAALGGVVGYLAGVAGMALLGRQLASIYRRRYV